MNEPQYMVKALVVEDNRLEASLMKEILKDFGCDVDLSQGLDVVERLKDHYDLIFLDINMPGINGFYLADVFNKPNLNKSKIPKFIVSSDSYTEKIKEKCIQCGVDGYIQKPISKKYICTIMDNFFSDKKINFFKNDRDECKGFFRG